MRRWTLLLAVLAAVVAGCGVDDDRRQARATVERFYDAVRRDDGASACGQLSPVAAAKLESQSEQSCRGVVTRLDLDGGEIVQVQVFVTNAKVDLRTGEAAFLSRDPAGWRLTAIGCKAEDGKPEHRPYECELEA